jgi:hypothetical protein
LDRTLPQNPKPKDDDYHDDLMEARKGQDMVAFEVYTGFSIWVLGM